MVIQLQEVRISMNVVCTMCKLFIFHLAPLALAFSICTSVRAEYQPRHCLLRVWEPSPLSLPFPTTNMRVVEIVIDGFKSYAVRTVISGWDESFNSITGLNGSGKSNILDAICFVLGITSMSTVRAQNIQVRPLRIHVTRN